MMKRNEMRTGKIICVWFSALFMLIGSIGIVPINSEAATKKYVKKISLSETELEMEEGDSEQIRYKVYVYKGASKKIKLKVSNSKVTSAKVRGNKISVYAKSTGESIITVISKAKNKRGKKIAKKIKVFVDEADNDDDVLDYDYDEDSEINNGREQTTTNKQPESKQVSNERAVIEQPTSGQLTTEQPTSEKLTSEKVTNEQIINEYPTSEQLTSEQPTSEKTTREELASEQITSEQPVNMQPQNEKPAIEQEATEQEKTKEKDTTLPVLTYQVNIKNDGWIPSVKDGSVSGKAASSKPIESFKLYLKDSEGNSALRYAAHIIGDGWQDWKTSGYIAGTQGQSKYIDSFKVTMLDKYTSLYDVYYRAYVQDYGWLGWAKNGEIAGSTGVEMPIEAIAVKIVEKDAAFDVKGVSYLKTPSLSYQSYVKGTGWQNAVGTAKTSGTTNTPLEAVKIIYTGFDGKNAISVNSHNYKTGWQGWKNGGETSGVIGSANCYDAVEMKLNSTMSKYYDIYYKVYVNKYGWLGWAKNGAIAGSTGVGLAVDAIQVKVVKKNASFDVGSFSYMSTPSLSYQSYVKGSGWQNAVGNAQTSGTTTTPIEAVKVTYTGFDGKNAISVNSHIFNSGWKGWKSNGEASGATGTSSYYDAVQIKLNDTMSKVYDVYYRVNVSDYGWLGWAKNGATAGSTEVGVPLTALQIRIVEKNASFNTNGSSVFSRVTMQYQANVESVGWQKVVMENGIAGTTGQSKKLTAISIGMNDFKNVPAITYNAHCSNVGWQGWKNSGIIAGGYGAEKPIEAIQIKLTSHLTKYFSVYYRMHVANYGWLGWAKDGEPAGTTGGGVPAEAIQIVIVSKLKSFDRGGTAYHELPPAQTNNVANGTAAKLVQVATSQVGYHEKASNSNLDDFTANSGYNNYTKYARDLGIANGNAWCATFIWWCMKTAGVKDSAYPSRTTATRDWFVERGLYHARGSYVPKPGDYVVMNNGHPVGHCGIVESVSGSTVYVIEGNSSDQVSRNSYNLYNSSKITGYGSISY